MSYNDFINKEISQKNILVELGFGGQHYSYVNFEPGIYRWDFTGVDEEVTYNFGHGAFGYGAFGSSGTGDLGGSTASIIISTVIIDGTQYASTINLTNLRTNEETYYFDVAENILYIHFDGGKRPDQFDSVDVSTVVPSCNNIPGIYNTIYYEPRVISVPGISKSIDPSYFGLISFESGTITLDNTDGKYDNVSLLDMFGRKVRVLFGGDDLEYDDYQLLYTASVDNYRITETELMMEIVDPRKKLEVPLVANVFNETDYPDMDENDIGKPIPLAYGIIKGAEPICSNPEAADDFNFILCDTTNHPIDAITTVYVNGVSVTPNSTNLTTGSFVLDITDYDPTDSTMNEVTVDFTGYEDDGGDPIINAMDVMKDLIVNAIDNVSYNDVYFNTTQWDEVATLSTDFVPEIAILIQDQTPLIDMIEEVSRTIYGNFLIDAAGLYSFGLYSPDTDSVKSVSKYEILNKLSLDYKSKEYISSVDLKYDKNYAADAFKISLNDTYEADLFKLYQRKVRRPYESFVTSSAAALTLSEKILARHKNIVPTFTIETKMQNADLELLDNINIQVDRPTKDWLGYIKCEVLGLDIDFNNNTVKLKLRVVDYTPDDIDGLDEEAETMSVYGDTEYYDGTYGSEG